MDHSESQSRQLCFYIFALSELKEDLKGKKEFEDYLTKLQIEKSDIQDRIEKNKAWIVSAKTNRNLSGPAHPCSLILLQKSVSHQCNRQLQQHTVTQLGHLQGLKKWTTVAGQL
jgi:hypothetical protein